MTYFRLRKPESEPEPEKEHEDEPTVEDEALDGDEPDGPHGAAGALWAGLSGPGRWLTARGWPGAAWALYVGSVWAVGFYGGWIAVGVGFVWLLFVLLFIPREALERWAATIERLGRSEKPAESEARELRKAAPEDVHAATTEWVHRQIGNTQGVHLRDLLQHAQQHGMFEDLDVTTFRGHLERWGIPVRSRVRVRGKGVTVGIHRDDLKPLSVAPSPPASQEPPKSGLHPA